MPSWHHLLEARIRDFNERRKKGEVKPAPDGSATGESLEVQLMAEIRDLRERARGAADSDEARELERRARQLETQLMVLLEKSGRPLMARSIAERLRRDEDEG